MTRLCRTNFAPRTALTMAASFAVALATVGCGIGSSITSADAGVTSAISGKLTGGPNPISGATITIYATGNSSGVSTGYGVGTALQSTTTGTNGNFTFAGGYSCPAGQFAYIVSAGGDSGSGVNSAAVLVDALGRCEDLYSGTTYTGGFIYMNELTSVAAAYALSGFATTSGNGSSTVVSIGAPATNNATAGSTTAAAGLLHAFQNAKDLVTNSVPASTANLTLPSNSSAKIPAQLLNSVGNSMIACVNTNSVSSSACSTFFGATGTATSSNTFGALLNLVANPTLAGTGYTPSDLFNIPTAAQTFYSPYLLSAPTDFSVAIMYPKNLGTSTGVQGLQYPYSGALDVNDNYYVGNYDSSSFTKSNVASFNSAGTLISFTTDNSTTVTGAGAVLDSTGILYLLGSSTGGAVARYSTSSSTGAVASSTPTSSFVLDASGIPLGSAVDKANNVWIGTSSTGTPKIYGVKSGATTSSYSKPFTSGLSGTAVAIDPNQNVWITRTGSTNSIVVFPNTGTAAAPVYSGSSALVTTTISGTSSAGVTFSALPASSNGYTGFVTSSGSPVGITPVTPTLSSATVTALSAGTKVTTGFSAPLSVRSDGDGNLWSADGTDLVKFTPSATSGISIKPCLPSSSSSNTTCTTNPYATLRNLSVDSTGSIWFVSPGTGAVGQIIGAAAPTWPLRALGMLSRP